VMVDACLLAIPVSDTSVSVICSVSVFIGVSEFKARITAVGVSTVSRITDSSGPA
jgi:hypothetical protein